MIGKLKKWIKKIFNLREKEIINTKFAGYNEEYDEREMKELLLLQDDICAKHHG